MDRRKHLVQAISRATCEWNQLVNIRGYSEMEFPLSTKRNTLFTMVPDAFLSKCASKTTKRKSFVSINFINGLVGVFHLHTNVISFFN